MDTERPAKRGGGSMTPIERAERARAIAAAHAAGATWEQVSERFGVSPRQARRLARQVATGGDAAATTALQAAPRVQEAAGEPRDVFLAADPFDPLGRALEAIEWAAGRLREEAERDDASAPRVGALKAFLTAESERLRLLVAVGTVPSRPAEIVRLEQTRELLWKVFAALREGGVDPAALNAAVAVVADAAGPLHTGPHHHDEGAPRV